MSENGKPSLTDTFREKTAATKKLTNLHGQRALNEHVPRGSWTEDRNLRTIINDGLPTFHDQTLIDVVSNLPPGATVWDLGSGDQAVALSELVSKFPELHLEGTGVTLPFDREDVQHPTNVTVVRQDVNEYLRGFDRSKRPDVIYMSKLLQWVPHPLSTLKLAYNALAPGGILFADEIHNINPPFVDEHGNPARPSVLEALLRKQGYDVEVNDGYEAASGVPLAYSLAMKKTENHPSLRLPIRL